MTLTLGSCSIVPNFVLVGQAVLNELKRTCIQSEPSLIGKADRLLPCRPQGYPPVCQVKNIGSAGYTGFPERVAVRTVIKTYCFLTEPSLVPKQKYPF